MDTLEKNIKNIAGETADKYGFFLVDLVIRGNINNRVIEVFVDGETDVTAEDCVKISREIENLLENITSLGSSYRLDVSSPGIERPLKFLRQYVKNINRNFEISYSVDNSAKKITAKLVKIVGEDLVFLSNDKKETIINFNNIKKAKVLVSFS